MVMSGRAAPGVSRTRAPASQPVAHTGDGGSATSQTTMPSA